ncbi:hypothetical protein JAAARDRAFT_56273 [Jaapia argillacea MUCL 33604]|uniref:Uncharacterized protein n=1 Tax=Jaapia argillacea MUCL 33604 TaxID=933084 RepID=A0A067PZX2_9AGAM|nr:hypothetical protein JAAARDRAFT_56273 [Jaapia argillacea MUCL 33604]
MTSSPLHFPTTPSSRSKRHSFGLGLPENHQPYHSSPLASSPSSSPIPAAQARRRSQYKSQTTPASSSARRRSSLKPLPHLFALNVDPRQGSPSVVEEPPQKALLRERFKARCFERAKKAREKAVKGKRWNELSSDGLDDMDCEMDDDEECEEALNDELFGRIMASVNRKSQYSYRVSYADEVGSSIDPDMEDIGQWEQELRGPPIKALATLSVETTPADLEEEELAAYAEEAAFYEDLEAYADDFFDDTDLEALIDTPPNEKEKLSGDADMDTS